MRKLEYLWVTAAVLVVLAYSVQSRADEFSGTLLGVDLGAGIPVSEFQDAADLGGVVAPFVGYRFSSGGYALTPMVRTQFGFFQAIDQDITYPEGEEPSAGGGRVIRRRTIESDVQTLFAGTGGFRVSLIDDTKELFGGAHGGYYTDLGGGPVRGAGPGFSLELGFNYQLLANTQIGAFIRRDEAYMRGNLVPANRDDHLEYLTTGLSFVQRIPAAVAAPPPPPPPPPPAPVPTPEPAAEMPEIQTKIVLRGVTFAFDSDRLSPEATPILDQAVASLKEAGDVQISIEGHTDSVGSNEYNLDLSRRRAESVRKYLEAQGIEAGRMQISGLGEEQPVATNDTAEGRAQNRRVELRVAE
jgi:OOP family OmpA-OmpF porin